MRISRIALLATVVALTAGSVLLQHSKTNAQSQHSASVAQATPLPAVRPMALGRIEPSSELLRLAAPAGQDSGRIAELRVKEGDWVQKGDVIAVLDTRARHEAALGQATATLALRKASLAKTVADLDSQEKTLTAAMEQQEAQRDRSKWELDRLQQLQRSGIYRDTALIDKRLAFEGAEHALQSARLLLERNRRRDATGLRIDEATAKAEVEVAEASEAKARADLEFTMIRAPIEGRIIRRIGRGGEQIASEGLVEIADTREMFVRAEVFESDLKNITLGMSTTVTSRALAQGVSGKVARIGLKVSRQSIIGEDPAAALDARVIDVLIRLDAPSSRLTEGLTGLQVRVAFEIPAAS